MTDDDFEVLHGGVANAGQVVRVGDHVLRPSNPHTPTIHRFLGTLADAGFDGASVPIAVDPDGRERLRFIEGTVAQTPLPDWFQTDATLASIGELMARFHRASAAVGVVVGEWSDEMADPAGGPIVCHNDVCPENVVFRDGEAVALIDFDYSAPGRPEWDLASAARMCGPVDDPVSAAGWGWEPVDQPARLRLLADAYGLSAPGRATLIESIDGSMRRGGEFVRRHVEAGDPGFVAMWERMGGAARYERRSAWWAESRETFARALDL